MRTPEVIFSTNPGHPDVPRVERLIVNESIYEEGAHFLTPVSRFQAVRGSEEELEILAHEDVLHIGLGPVVGRWVKFKERRAAQRMIKIAEAAHYLVEIA